MRWVLFLMSPDILTSLSIYLMVLLAVLLVDKSMYDIGLIHPKSSAAQKNPLLIAQCGSALLSSSNNRVSLGIEIKAGHPNYYKIPNGNCGSNRGYREVLDGRLGGQIVII